MVLTFFFAMLLAPPAPAQHPAPAGLVPIYCEGLQGGSVDVLHLALGCERMRSALLEERLSAETRRPPVEPAPSATTWFLTGAVSGAVLTICLWAGLEFTR